MTSETAFWTKIAPKYSEKPISDVASYEETLDRVRGYLSPTDRVIEFGAGTGSTAVKLAPSVAQYIATDFSDGMIQIAERRKTEARSETIETAVGEVADFTEAEVNVALAFNLFHLVPDMRGDFSRIFDMLPPGGLFIQKTPSIAKLWFMRLPIWLMGIVGKAPKTLTYLKPEDVDAALKQAGFEIIEADLIPKKSYNRFVVARKPAA